MAPGPFDLSKWPRRPGEDDDMTCTYCAGGEHTFCESPATCEASAEAPGFFTFECCCSERRSASPVVITGEARPVGRPPKDADDMIDLVSAGRHRAARALPNIEGTPCHWRGLLNAGGGAIPIIGCLSGLASDRHHGPDKSVLNNEVGVNLHAVCDDCHNRWHTLNDPLYPPIRPDNGEPFIPLSGVVIPHDNSSVATQQQLIKNMVWWATSIEGREPYSELRN